MSEREDQTSEYTTLHRCMLMKVHVFGCSDSEYEMFKREASILLRIKAHDNVVSLIGLCAVPGHYALVTEFVNGGSLSSLLFQSSDRKEEVEKWHTRVMFAKQVADGMLHLHYRHPFVIHQDLKSQNVLVKFVPYLRIPFICKVELLVVYLAGSLELIDVFRCVILVFPECLESYRLRIKLIVYIFPKARLLTWPPSAILPILTGLGTIIRRWI